MTDEANGKLLDSSAKKLDEETLEPSTAHTSSPTDSFTIRLLRTWEKLKFKSTLGHLGLLLSLAVYCAVGGYVSAEIGKKLTN
jgi:hypothetical protein